jgi:hypothetical protein
MRFPLAAEEVVPLLTTSDKNVKLSKGTPILCAIAFKTEFLLAPDHIFSSISIKITHKSKDTPEPESIVGCKVGLAVGFGMGCAVGLAVGFADGVKVGRNVG